MFTGIVEELGTVVSREGAKLRIAATAESGVFGDGFQMVMSPHTAARKAFQLHTATGKLKALMTPMEPRGSHCSRIAWPGLSLGMVRP